MMNELFILLAILTAIIIGTVLLGRPHIQIDSTEEARRLIEQYQAGKKYAQADNETRQFHLYQELSAIVSSTTQRKIYRLPLWVVFFALVTSLFAFFWWYHTSGKDSLRWKQITEQLSPTITRVQARGKSSLPTTLPPENLIVFCQALQRVINREDAVQLEALASCYSAAGYYDSAEKAYAQLLRQVETPDIIIAWAQAKTLAEPDKPISKAVETRLKAALKDAPNHLIGRILLASAYQQQGRLEEAQPIWASLLHDIPNNHPLREVVIRASAQNPTPASAQTGINVTINIDTALIAQLSPTARLFISASTPDTKMPIAVRSLVPKEQQHIVLNDENTMRGKKLTDYSTLIIHARLSTDGNALSPPLAQAYSKPISTIEHTPITLTLSHE